MGSNSSIIGLAESRAYYMGHFLTDLKYGISSVPDFFQHR